MIVLGKHSIKGTANQDRVTANSHLKRLSLRLAASQGESLMRAIYPLPWVQRFSGGKRVLWAYSYPLTKNVNKSVFSQSS